MLIRPNRNDNAAGDALLAWLGQLEAGPAMAYGGLAVFPIFSPGKSPLAYRTLDEALAEGWAEVREKGAGNVPELLLANRGTEMLLVLEGEEIVGGLQNRIVNASFLVAPGSQVVLPVTCVEHGRWHGVSARFAPGEASFLSLRAATQAQVSHSRLSDGGLEADQGAVWHMLADRHASADSRSETGAMHDLYDRRRGELGDYERSLAYVPGASGLIASLDGRVAGADLFDQPRTAGVLWAKLVRSYAMDADYGSGAPAAHERALEFLQRAQGGHCWVYPSLALGEDVRLEGHGVIGSGLVYQGTPVHVSLFSHEGRPERRLSSGMARSSARRRLQQRDM